MFTKAHSVLVAALFFSAACQVEQTRARLPRGQAQAAADSGPTGQMSPGNGQAADTGVSQGSNSKDAAIPPSPGGTDGGNTTVPGGTIGSACASDSQCASGPGSCLQGTSSWWTDPWVGGYCTMANCSEQNPCADNGTCVSYDDQMNTTCLAACASDIDCRSGYFCHEVGGCLPGATSTGGGGAGSSPVGGACTADSDCRDSGASCIAEQGSSGPSGFVGGYCTVFSCSETQPCPGGSECFTVNSNGTTACLANCQQRSQCRGQDYACHPPGACLPACDANSCDPGEVCGSDGLCVNAPCTPGSCPMGLTCDQTSGQCVVEVGAAPSGPIPTCNNLPNWRCNESSTRCAQLTAFEPTMGPGYWNYPLNGETNSNQYRSYLRYDFVQLLKYAAASVDCLSANWSLGSGHPIGLGDMSEANGTIPGTSDGSPGHPAGTHEDGHDIDIAYYQLTGSNNWLRSICPHTSGSADQYHCVGPPTNLDVWRTALFVGKIHETSGLRVIGMDGQIGPLVESALTQLCARGWLNNSACTSPQITYETTDMGRGWFRFHHHHMHVSITSVINLVSKPASEACLVPNDCSGKLHDTPHMCQTDSDFSRWTLPSSLGKSLRAY